MALTKGQRARSFEAATQEARARDRFVDGLCGPDFFGGGVSTPCDEDVSEGESTPSAQKPNASGGTFGDMIP